MATSTQSRGGGYGGGRQADNGLNRLQQQVYAQLLFHPNIISQIKMCLSVCGSTIIYVEPCA